LLGDEGVIGTMKVVGRHADGLGLGFGLDRLVDVHVPFLLQHLLGHAVGEGRTGSQILRQLQRIGEQHRARTSG
jgi:hypothetical protein